MKWVEFKWAMCEISKLELIVVLKVRVGTSLIRIPPAQFTAKHRYTKVAPGTACVPGSWGFCPGVNLEVGLGVPISTNRRVLLLALPHTKIRAIRMLKHPCVKLTPSAYDRKRYV